MASVTGIQRYKGQLAVVTGASSGIGAAVCAALLSNGINVVGVSRSKERMSKAAQSWGNLPGSYASLECDLSEPKQADALIGQVLANHGRPSILVNNAGIALQGAMLQSSTEDFSKMMNVNVISVSAITRDFVKALREANADSQGHVINVSSLAAHRVPPVSDPSRFYVHFYSATKFALRALSEGIRCELRACKSPIKVSCISPGMVTTNFFENLPIDPNSSMLQPQDVADGVIYALSAPQHAEIGDVMMRPIERMN